MTADKIVDLLLVVNLAGSAAILAVLALRGIVRRLAGARSAYMAWLIVPAAIAATLLPARTIEIPAAPPAAIPASQQVAKSIPVGVAVATQRAPTPISAPTSGPAPMPALPMDLSALVSLVWLAGAIAALSFLAIRQVRAMRALGRLTRISATTSRATQPAVGPAVVGVFAPRIVLPANFEEAFNATEQKVVLAHEEAHLRGRHTFVKAFVEIAVCLSWFNPLAYLAARSIAIDQELACDEAVASRYPSDRKVYAGALLKAQGGLHMPLGCYWPASSAETLKARIRRLSLATPSSSRRIVSAGALTLLAIVAGCTAWAARPAQTRVVEAVRPSAEAAADAKTSMPQVTPAPQEQTLRAQDGPDANAPIYLRGKVEKIDFRKANYVAYVRASSIADSENAPAQANTALWELAPINYWGDQDTVTKDLMNASIAARGVTAAKTCSSACRLIKSDIIVPTSSALPSPSGAFSMADFALRYDTGKAYVIHGTVERIEFAERTFDAYVRTEARGPIPGALFQVRSENRFPRAEVEKALLNKVITVAGWRAKKAPAGAGIELWPDGPIEPACDAVCGLYGTDIELPNNTRLTPAADRLVSAPPQYDPDFLPLVVPGYAAVAEITDRNAPLTLTGKVTKVDNSGGATVFYVEALRVLPDTVPGASRGTVWRVVTQDIGAKPEWVGGTLVAERGFNAKDKSCQPTCLMGTTYFTVGN